MVSSCAAYIATLKTYSIYSTNISSDIYHIIILFLLYIYLYRLVFQLPSIFTQIFNRSLEQCEVPSCFKRFTIILIPKKHKITGLNYYRPVALRSVVMKSFERPVLDYLKDITGHLLDPLQFP